MTPPPAFAHRLAAYVPDPAAPIAVAVSGGPDSLALLLFAQAVRPGHIHAATVDHGLRPAGAVEAAQVAALCAARGIPHVILGAAWPPATGRGIQADARAHRYRLLDGWCRDVGIGHILTAHHRDDQAETLLMRLARGSGTAGLAGIRPARPLRPGSPVLLLRPLLDTPKAALIAAVAAAGLAPADDPSNRDPRHDRTHARALLAATPWLEPVRIAAAAHHLAAAEDALVFATDQVAATRIAHDSRGHRLLDPASLPQELVRRLVLRCLEPGGTEDAPRGPALDRLIRTLEKGSSATLGRTLARAGSGGWTFGPAPPRSGPRNPV